MQDSLKALFADLDSAVQLQEPVAITRSVKERLEHAVRARAIVLPERFHHIRAEGYARRLLHKNDELGYTAVVMTWAPGQGTPLHDHAGIWCVECVIEGRMDVTQYDLVGHTGGTYCFERKGLVHASVGSAGCLIPPFEFHVLANADAHPSITLHIYGGEMTTCHVFEPAGEGRFVRRERALGYHD